MDGSRFDFWTRRRAGQVAGGIAASLIGLADPAPLDAKKKKKKRCKKLGSTCSPGGRKCCKGNACAPVEALGPTLCCKQAGKPCASSDECCDPGECASSICQIKK